jgi:hypothetical protein
MNADFRVLADNERQALKKILDAEFSGREQMVAQIDRIGMRRDDETLYRFAPFALSQSLDVVQQTHGVPVEASYQDEDGAIVFVWLFANEQNELAELEVWKPNGSEVIKYFADAELSIRLLEEKTKK